jgi:flavorubredoxin
VLLSYTRNVLKYILYVPVDHMSFWDNETLKIGKKQFKFIMTPHVHHWDSMMIFEETTRSLFPSDPTL